MSNSATATRLTFSIAAFLNVIAPAALAQGVPPPELNEPRVAIPESVNAAPAVAPLAAPAMAPAGAALAAPATYDWKIYLWWECRVNWNQYCDANQAFVAWTGWQACSMLYSLDSGNHGIRRGPNIARDQLFTLDPINPPSFRRYTVTFHAEGRWNWPQAPEDALMRLNDVGVRMISETAGYAERLKAGCDIL
jgi:hypothetical protein